MKKETIIAAIFGISLGLLIALLVIFQSNEKQLSKAKPINNQTKESTSKVNIAITTPFLEISFPTDKLVLDTNSTKIKGRSNKNSLIIIQSPIKEIVFKNEKEEFEKDFPLAMGENVIELTNYPKDVNLPAVHKQLVVYYLVTKEVIE